MRIFYLITFLLLLVIPILEASSIVKAEIVGNVIEVQESSFNNNIIEIGGDVMFIENQFIPTNDYYSYSHDTTTELSLTHSWNNQPKGYHNYPVYGYGSYLFKIKIPEKFIGESFILRPNHFIAYSSEGYVNGKLAFSNGNVGKSVEDSNYNPARHFTVNPFSADSTVLEVVVWVANYNHFRGGIFNEIKFGLAEDMILQRERAVVIDMVIIISLLIMFLYHFVFYFVNRIDTMALFFSFTCLIFAIDLSLQDTMSFFLLFPTVGFKLSSFLHLTMPYLLPSSFIFFLYSLFPNETSKRIRNASALISIVLIALTSIGIVNLSSVLVKPHFIYVFALIVYIYWVVIKAIKNNREGAILFLVAYTIFGLCAVNDILHVFEVIHTASLVSSGLIVFVFLLSVLQGNRMVLMNFRNKKLSESLQELNVNLEKKVEERTDELNESIEKLQSLGAFKEDMTNMIIHDLKAPLSSIINIKQLNNEDGLNLVQQSGYKMLNLIQNILGVYKYQNTKVDIMPTNVSLSDLVNSAILEVKIMADLKMLEIEFNADNGCELLADEDLMVRVLVNLLSNAIKFSPENAIVKIQASTNTDSELALHIINYGPAIPKEKQELIFERFGQVKKEKSGDVGSTGLGLTFCKMVVEAHGGTIGVDSKPESEVDFWFVIPNCSCKECGNCNTLMSNDTEKSLSASENQYLNPFIERLRACKVYQVTTINKIINEITSENINIVQWLKALDKAIYHGDEEKFIELLK